MKRSRIALSKSSTPKAGEPRHGENTVQSRSAVFAVSSTSTRYTVSADDLPVNRRFKRARKVWRPKVWKPRKFSL